MTARSIPWAVAVVFAAVIGQVSAAETTWKNVPVVDTSCIAKVKDNPDAHTRECAIQCVKGGYGLIAQDGSYLPFDQAGNDLVIAALKASARNDHLRATVVGERKEDRIQVRSFSLD
jgi:hypothetical protein